MTIEYVNKERRSSLKIEWFEQRTQKDKEEYIMRVETNTNRLIILLDKNDVPYVYLTSNAKEELKMIYGGGIPYETYAFLAAMFPLQSEKNPIDEKGIGKLLTVTKFRQATGYELQYSPFRSSDFLRVQYDYQRKELLRGWLKQSIRFFQGLLEKVSVAN